MVVVPTRSPDDWRGLLADPDRHWRQGYSAFELAHRWQAAEGDLPPEVQAAFEASGAFAGARALLTLPEHRVPLPGGSRPSQSDAWVLGGWDGGLFSMTVEGKVSESFGPTLAERFSAGEDARLAFLLRTLGLVGPLPGDIRYQLLHRTASALLEAVRFHASRAVLLVHSFSPADVGWPDFVRFAELFGASPAGGELVPAGAPGGIELFLGWARGVAEPTR
jgi:hypothetical protein